MKSVCALCHQPLPVSHFPTATPPYQQVFTWRDGRKVHCPPCPERGKRGMPINQEDEE